MQQNLADIKHCNTFILIKENSQGKTGKEVFCEAIF
jgi:hypothetical protein